MGIAQIALAPPPQSNRPMWKKSAPNHHGKSLHPRANVGKSAPNYPGKPLHHHPLWAMPIPKQHISKRGFPYTHSAPSVYPE